MVVNGMLDNGLLLCVRFDDGEHACLALVHAGPCTRPIHPVADLFVFRERVVADF